jgi:hypothetical protein
VRDENTFDRMVAFAKELPQIIAFIARVGACDEGNHITKLMKKSIQAKKAKRAQAA